MAVVLRKLWVGGKDLDEQEQSNQVGQGSLLAGASRGLGLKALCWGRGSYETAL